jgi:hypothetical protein
MKHVNYLLKGSKGHQKPSIYDEPHSQRSGKLVGHMEPHVYLPHLLHRTGTQERSLTRLHYPGVTGFPGHRVLGLQKEFQ